MSPKKIITYLLRKLYLLPFVDRILLLYHIQLNKKSNNIFGSLNPDFICPPNDLAFDAYNHTNWKNYHHMGEVHSTLIKNLSSKYLKATNIKILEWGCGPARVIRHIQSFNGFNRIDRFGTDYNKSSIKWCQENIQDIVFKKNELSPPLDFQDNTFDCIYALSIFTHLSESLHFDWIKELMRVKNILQPTSLIHLLRISY